MRILIAPDSFKGSLDALTAAHSLKAGALRVFPSANCALLPVADGGEGTVAALVAAVGGKIVSRAVRGPLGEVVTAFFGLLGDGRSAVVETAAASGLPLVPPERRNALAACTYGTGQLMAAALEALRASGLSGPPRLIIGLGGSATSDGGAGAMRALGARFTDSAGLDLPPGGAALARLAHIDLSGLHPLLAQAEILAACDVDNPLCGQAGASAVFGPQKGATPEMVVELDAALSRYAEIAAQSTGRNVADLPGAGAAGGLGAGLLFFTGARLRPGVELMLEAADFDRRVQEADLVLTGEGHTDFQTAFGKAPAGVARAAKRHGRPVVCVSGGLGRGASDILDLGVDALEAAVCAPMNLEDCLERAAPMLEDAAERACRLLLLGMKLGGGGNCVL